MMIRKAEANDIDAVEKLYDAIHTAEENGKQTIGWIRGIYPVRKTAEMALARENGCTELRIDTNARNAVARAMYKKHGYTEIGIVPTVFNGIEGVQLVLLEKYLG